MTDNPSRAYSNREVVCPHCQTQNPEGARFCGGCATHLGVGSSKVLETLDRKVVFTGLNPYIHFSILNLLLSSPYFWGSYRPSSLLELIAILLGYFLLFFLGLSFLRGAFRQVIIDHHGICQITHLPLVSKILKKTLISWKELDHLYVEPIMAQRKIEIVGGKKKSLFILLSGGLESKKLNQTSNL